MSLDAAHPQLVAVLTADAELTAWVTTHFGQALTVLNGNRELKEFRNNELPVLVFELGDGESEPLNNARYADAAQEIRFGVVWYEPDFDAAFIQRRALPDIMVKALLRNKTLNGTVSEAAVSNWSFAQGVDNPDVHSARFSASLAYGLNL